MAYKDNLKRNASDRRRRKSKAMMRSDYVDPALREFKHMKWTATHRAEQIATLHKFFTKVGASNFETQTGIGRTAVEMLVNIIEDDSPECADHDLGMAVDYLVKHNIMKVDYSGRGNQGLIDNLAFNAKKHVPGREATRKPLAFDQSLVDQANAHATQTAQDRVDADAQRVLDLARAEADMADYDEEAMDRFGMKYNEFLRLYPDLFTADGDLVVDVDAKFAHIGIRTQPPVAKPTPYDGPSNSGGAEGDALVAGMKGMFANPNVGGEEN